MYILLINTIVSFYNNILKKYMTIIVKIENSYLLKWCELVDSLPDIQCCAILLNEYITAFKIE